MICPKSAHPKSFDLTGKVALITGASYGIGFAIAHRHGQLRRTPLFSTTSSRSWWTRAWLLTRRPASTPTGYVCDVTNEDQVAEFIKKVTEEVGHINILVNNAGIIKRIPMCDMTAAQFRQVIDVDLNGPFIVSKAVIPDMIQQGGGKIINICSMMSELGRETVSAYAAAKGGLKMLTKNIASRVRRLQHPVQRHRPRLHCHPADRTPCVRSSPTAAVIPSTSSSSPRPRPAAGARPLIWAAPLSSWLPRLPTLSTA